MKNLKLFLLIISLVFFLNIFLNFSLAALYIVKDQEGNNICITNQETLISKYKALGYIIITISGSSSSQKSSESKSNFIQTLNDQETDSIIKVVDWVNYVGETGNYIYAEGILQNIGKVSATNLKVVIQALDKNNKLVSITDSYAEPSTLEPNEKAIFKIMIKYKPEIENFTLSVIY